MQGYAQGVLWTELYIDPFVECFKIATLGKSCWQKLSLPEKIYLSMDISADFLLIVSYIQGALRKELFGASFVELFKNANLGNSYW